MVNDEKYIKRCLELAKNGMGFVAPNPMVGCVIVKDGIIIGEGYHKKYGGPHAEIEAINSVPDKELCKGSTLYVNLEPCSHYGKTPPCSNTIVEYGFSKVVVGCRDSNPEVAGKGIERLKKAGIDVLEGVLEQECRDLNCRFFTFHEHKRPYIILKWAESKDGFMATNDEKQLWITGKSTKTLVHKWRTEENAILVGRKTVSIDNPLLTARLFDGANPLRITIDNDLKLDDSLNLFNDDAPTLVFNQLYDKKEKNVEYIRLDTKKESIQQIIDELYARNILSLIVEGGRNILDQFIALKLFDEVRILIGDITIEDGIPAPKLNRDNGLSYKSGSDTILIINDIQH